MRRRRGVYTDADLIHSGLLTMRIGDDETDAGTEAATAPAAAETPAAAAGTSGGGDPDGGPRHPARGRRATVARPHDRSPLGRRARRAPRRRAPRPARTGCGPTSPPATIPRNARAIEQERLAALAELEETRTEAYALARAVDDLRDEARRADVPPGWLR